MQTKSPCERDSSWVLRELKVLIGLHREYKELGGIINYLNQLNNKIVIILFSVL